MGTPFQVTIPESENDIEVIKKRWMKEECTKHGDFLRMVRQAMREYEAKLQKQK